MANEKSSGQLLVIVFIIFMFACVIGVFAFSHVTKECAMKGGGTQVTLHGVSCVTPTGKVIH